MTEKIKDGLQNIIKVQKEEGQLHLEFVECEVVLEHPGGASRGLLKV